MNNHYLFLIRSDYVTQLGAHLAAGILALILVSSLTAAPKETPAPVTRAVVRLAPVALPATAQLLATAK